MRQQVDGTQVRLAREKVKAAFAALRKDHFMLARMAHLCCMSCASSDLYDTAQKRREKGYKLYSGVVYFHRQDDESFWASGYLMIRFMGKHDPEDSLAYPTQKVAELVIKALKDQGLEAKWDGNTDRCIEVKV